ncbi:uncharacterized protein SPAPADRAFT_158096 [Spathaspora passalidarum NRRL Y-27907]|uniref:RING-type E3 ubiquitin transferase n=1 Tax=Spathaspora passalidarum (strain NRRL Y-27907 / 11-Y1) TaxID=619300 RepID=G3AVG6_SPAPN|nr:uncharacterized protein SPAPADRAFT_158096 [Spathaspora passalidarum NRRL Y-27907]EGW29915.1 hypothetical protein SPAPADRAFT_158096 [Spathaspora passalidarum NRRL Y-27907]
MSEVDHTCRICRGEATLAQPLYHPCKCKGSIKYIHQDCLLEWLKHANKSTEKCDICNTPYKFKILYDPNMPKRIPLEMIFNKLIETVSNLAVKSVSVALYIFCILIEVPIFWKFIGRAYTWVLDGQLPPQNPTFINALVFGEADITTYLASSPNLTPVQVNLLSLRKFFTYTYFSGVRYIVVFIIVHIALFIEREWIVRDEGYAKLLMKRIGKERKTALADILQDTLERLREGNPDADVQEAMQRVERAIFDLQGNNMGILNDNRQQDLRRAIEEGIMNIQNPPQNEQPDQAPERRERQNEDDNEEDNVHNEQEPGHPAVEEEEEEQEQQVDADGEQQDGFPEPNNDFAPGGEEQGGAFLDMLEVFGAHLDLKTPIMYMAIIDIVVLAYLFIIYFVPHLIGNVLAAITGFSMRFLHSKILNKVYTIVVSNDKVNHLLTTKIEQLRADHDYSLVERIVLLSIGYAVICATIYKCMQVLLTAPGPVIGTTRKVYKVLFEVSSTAKVFLIFAIEIFFFPVYCGWLLDFCFAPLLLPTFSITTKSGSQYIVLITSFFEILQVTYLRIFLYWASGTLYMLFFALFVGMVRSSILRPGVLFFIRSPDDPNARLIHDALMKPLALQLSRIYLSAKVYTGFILFGIGGVTWGLRYLVTSSSNVDYNVFLPIQLPSYFTVLISGFLFNTVADSHVLITKYVRRYWHRAFELSAHKLRLSHFILGKPISHERGHVVYRNLWHQLLGQAQPDYTKPVSYREAVETFKENPSVNACFVPDGNYVRAPDNDTVSRKFIKKLFVAVTKDDKLLEVPHENKKRSGYETPSDEEDEGDFTGENAYAIVYRPPNFRMRCFGLIFLLWVFAVILILSCAVVAVLMGRPILRANSYLYKAVAPTFIYQDVDLDWRLADFGSIAIGLVMQIKLLKFYDKSLVADAPQGGNNEIQLGREQVDGRLFQGLLDFGRLFNRMPKALVLSTPSAVLWINWIISVHRAVVINPVRYTTGRYNQDLLFDPPTVFLHFIVSFWTILPFLFYLRPIPQQITMYQALWTSGIVPCLINYTMVHLPALLTIFFSHYYRRSSDQLDVYIWPVLFVMFVAIKLIHGGLGLYSTLNDQVKKEKYVRGRAIENVDTPEN